MWKMFSNTINPLSKERIDELLRFLPLFEQPGRQFVERWEDANTITFPVYIPEVKEFFQLASQLCWYDASYRVEQAETMLKDPDLVVSADLDQIKKMLTYCVRGERYYYGHWLEILESGQLVALLKRLRVLRSSM
jgi:hypothetical protein